MRQQFEQRSCLQTVAIQDVKFPLKSHDELLPVLKALQYIFITPELNKNLPGVQIYSHSFDKGFWSRENWETLEQSETKQVILPKRGKLTKTEKQRQGAKEFKELCHVHSAIESDINMPEHHGLNRCIDKRMQRKKRE